MQLRSICSQAAEQAALAYQALVVLLNDSSAGAATAAALLSEAAAMFQEPGECGTALYWLVSAALDLPITCKVPREQRSYICHLSNEVGAAKAAVSSIRVACDQRIGIGKELWHHRLFDPLVRVSVIVLNAFVLNR